MSVSVSGRRWAYIGAALGGTVSIAANIAHSYVPPRAAGCARITPESSPTSRSVIPGTVPYSRARQALR